MSRTTPIHERIVGGVGALLLSILSILSIETAFASEPLHDPTLHDPTEPPAAALTVDDTDQKPNADLELRAIFHADDRRIAVINGRRVGVADQIGGARILAIEKNRVRLERGGEIVELELVSPAFENARRADERASIPASATPGDTPNPDPQGASR